MTHVWPWTRRLFDLFLLIANGAMPAWCVFAPLCCFFVAHITSLTFHIHLSYLWHLVTQVCVDFTHPGLLPAAFPSSSFDRPPTVAILSSNRVPLG